MVVALDRSAVPSSSSDIVTTSCVRFDRIAAVVRYAASTREGELCVFQATRTTCRFVWLYVVIFFSIGCWLGCRGEPTASAPSKKYEVAEADRTSQEESATASPGLSGLPGLADSSPKAPPQEQLPEAPLSSAPATASGRGSAPSDATDSSRGASVRQPGAAQAGLESVAGDRGVGSETPRAPASVPGGSAPPASTSSQAGQPIKPPAISRDQIENLEPPEGPPEAIWAFIEALSSRRPRGRTQGEVLEDMRAMLRARLTAAERIFDHPQSDPELRKKSVDVVLTSLQYLNELNAPDVLKTVRTFCSKMAADRDEGIAATGRLMLFSLDVGDLVDGKTTDPEGVLTAARKLIAQEQKSRALFEHLRTAALSMLQTGHRDAGLQLIREIVTAFEGSTDNDLLRQVRLMQEEARFLELDLATKLVAFTRNEPNSVEALLAGVNELLSGENLWLGTLQQASFIGDALERNNQLQAAKQVYDQIEKAYATSQDAEIQQLVKETVEYARRRLGLLQKPFVPTGRTFDGRPFQWSDYQGKVVLVTFWSAENLQFLANDLPQIKRLRDVYKDRGFDVVGVNIDSNRRLVEQFMAFQPMPWVTIMDGSDGKGKLLEQCGVRSIPFTLLIDQNGVVTDMHVTAQTLPEKLLKLLSGVGPANPPGQGAPPASPQGAWREGRQQAVQFVAYYAVEDGPAQQQTADSASDDNPYLAPADLSRDDLVRFLERMAEKPSSIRSRPGFDEAVIEAAERVLRENTQDKAAEIALYHLAYALHRRAANDVAGAQEKLEELVSQWKNDTRPSVAAWVRWLLLEQALLNVDQLPLEEVPQLLAQVERFFQENKPGAEHLRMASATVHAINRLEVAKREAYFQKFGKLFASSADRTLAQYGKRILAGEESSDASIVGERVQVEGLTAAGVELKWHSYEGKIVVIDFWATWCGPCLREMPKLKALYEKWHDQGLEVIGVNLDRDGDAVARYLQDNPLDWPVVVGRDATELARRYGVRAIPWLLLVDRDSRVVRAVHQCDQLEEAIEKLLKSP
jgi:thiol-disulfide isomerase/thioredoxin